MAQFDMTIEGGDILLKMLRESGQDSGKVMGAALYEEAQIIFAKSQSLVPVDTGVLRSSGDVSAPQQTADGLAVDIFYGGPAASYALLVHEIMYYRHNPPTQAKYLEQPFMQQLPDIQRNLASRILRLITEKGKK